MSVQELYPIVFQMLTQPNRPGEKGQSLVRIRSNGEVTIDANAGNTAVAEAFWRAVGDKILQQREMQLLTDLCFIRRVLKSKGLFYSNPNEKIEISAWLGEIERRYGLDQES